MSRTGDLLRAGALLAPLALGASSLPGWAQAPALPAAGVFARLEQLQSDNLAVGKKIAEAQRQAAGELQAALNSGGIAKPEHQEIARVFIGNGLTLASIAISPARVGDTGSGMPLTLLIQRNIALLQSVAAFAAQDPVLSAALARYSALQVQSQNLSAELQAGWSRYADVVTEATSSGQFPANGFDPQTRSWSLATPAAGGTPSAAAAAAEPPAPTLEPVAPPAASATPAAPAPAAAPAVVAAPAAPQGTAQPMALVPVPALSGQPAVAPATAMTAPATDTVVVPAAAPGTGTPQGAWPRHETGDGAPLVSSPNVETAATPIKALVVRCGADGSPEFFIDSSEQFSAYRIYADATQYRSIEAAENVIGGAGAIAMSDTLRLAHAWTQEAPAENRQFLIRADTMSGPPGRFSPHGYPDAMSWLREACANPRPAAAPTTAAPVEPVPAPPAETPAAAASAAPAGTEPAAPAVTRAPGVTAPIPLPRPQRPVDIMSGATPG